MKKFAALLLSLLLVLSLAAGCQSGDDTSSTPSTAPVNSPAPGNPSTDPDEPEDGYVYRMPITEGDTFTAFRNWSSTLYTSPNEILVNIELEKNTGIKLEWELASSADVNEKFNLLFASGSLPDLIYSSSPSQYMGGIDKAIADENYLRLNEYIDLWAPEYKARMADKETYRQIVTDSGNIGTFACIQEGNEPAWLGPMARYDWLSDMGKEPASLVTYDDWYEVLAWLKNEKGVEAPLFMTATCTENTGYFLGVSSTFYNENGTVKFGVLDDSFRDYIEMLCQWNSEGLLGVDFSTNTSWYMNASPNLSNGVNGITIGMSSQIANYTAVATDPNFEVGAIRIPVRNAGDTGHFRRYNFIVGDMIVVVTPTAEKTDEHLENVIRWMDYRYSEEGSMLLGYGIEGMTYNYTAEGKPLFSDMILSDPDGLAPAEAQRKYVEDGAGVYYRWIRNWAYFGERQLACNDIWGAADGAYIMPAVTLTDEEGRAYSATFGDIDTLIQERLPAFVLGQRPMSEWDGFIQELHSMGIDTCIGYQQAALDRFMAR